MSRSELPRGSHIVRTQHGAFCAVCQSHLSMEEDDWDECDACGGEGIGQEEEEDDEPDEVRAAFGVQP